MIDLNKLSEEIINNKLNKGFNTTDPHIDFCGIMTEVGEAIDAYRKQKDDLGEELADIIIYVIGLSKMLNIDIEKEILNKIEKNKNRAYTKKAGEIRKTKTTH